MKEDVRVTGTFSPTFVQLINTGTVLPLVIPESGRRAITLDILEAASAKALPSIVITRLFDIGSSYITSLRISMLATPGRGELLVIIDAPGLGR
jgi:hypothetical protein